MQIARLSVWCAAAEAFNLAGFEGVMVCGVAVTLTACLAGLIVPEVADVAGYYFSAERLRRPYTWWII
jgi:hypothetical protein